MSKSKEFLLVNLESFEPRFFAVPGGGLNEGESLEDAMYREIKEELGIEEKHLEMIGFSDSPTVFNFKTVSLNRDGIKYIGSERYFFGFIFTGEARDIKPQDGEVRLYKWVSYDDLNKYLLFDNQLEETVSKIDELFAELVT